MHALHRQNWQSVSARSLEHKSGLHCSELVSKGVNAEHEIGDGGGSRGDGGSCKAGRFCQSGGSCQSGMSGGGRNGGGRGGLGGGDGNLMSSHAAQPLHAHNTHWVVLNSDTWHLCKWKGHH